MPLNVKSKKIFEKLNTLNDSGEFKKYPGSMLRNNSIVRVNPDDYLMADEFFIVSPYCNLPKEIYLYGKRGSNDDNIFLNYWMNIFLKSIENGYLNYEHFDKSTSKYELTIGIPYNFRRRAFERTWTRKDIIQFLSCSSILYAKLLVSSYFIFIFLVVFSIKCLISFVILLFLVIFKVSSINIII